MEQARVEEVRRLPPRLGRELPKSQHAGVDGRTAINSCAMVPYPDVRTGHSEVLVFRLVSLNLNGICSASSKGFRSWAEGRAPTLSACKRSNRRPTRTRPAFSRSPATRATSTSPRKRAIRGAGVYSEGDRAPCASVSATRSSMPKDATSKARFDRPVAQELRKPEHRQLLLPDRLVRPATSGSQVPLPRPLPAVPEKARPGARGHLVRRHQHRPQGNRPEELEG